MEADQYSRTALFTTVLRAHHYSQSKPHILEDQYAQMLMSDTERQATVSSATGVESERTVGGWPRQNTGATGREHRKPAAAKEANTETDEQPQNNPALI